MKIFTKIIICIFLLCSIAFAQADYQGTQLQDTLDNFLKRIIDIENTVASFLDSEDTPDTYTDYGNYIVSVSETEDSVEFKYEVLDEDDMSSDSVYAVSTQQSLKAYVDGRSAANTYSTDETDNSLETVFTGTNGQNTTASYVKIWEVKMPMGGTIELTFTVTSDNDHLVYAQSYINGVAVGTAASSGSSSSPTTRTEDIDIEMNDLLQIYAKGSGSQASKVSNILVKSTNFTEIVETYP